MSGVFSDGAQPFGFTGYMSDEISGLYYAQARYYEPNLGRFGAEDIIRDGLNWYGYCNGNPLRFIDPSGLTTFTDWDRENVTGGNDVRFLHMAIDEWQEAYARGDQAGMDRAFQRAEAIRNRHRRADEVGTADGDTVVFLDPNRRYRSWDRFSSPENAAIAFSLTYVDVGLSRDREIGAYIYRVAGDMTTSPHYTFGGRFVGRRNHTVFPMIRLALVPQRHPRGRNIAIVGQVHTHPISETGGLWFSPQDMQLANGDSFEILLPAALMAVLTLGGRREADPHFPNPFGSMFVFISSRNPNEGDAIQVRMYIPNSGQDAWGELIWQCEN